MLCFQRKSFSFISDLRNLQAFTSDSHAFLWKRSSQLQHFNSLCEVNGVFLDFLNAVLSEKMTFFWKYLKLVTCIHRKLTCVSLKEKQSFPWVQFTVRSEWSVVLLSKCCSFRENHIVLNVYWANYKHSQETHKSFSEREAVCSNTSIHYTKLMECCFTF